MYYDAKFVFFKELQSFQTKVRHQIEMEDEILGLRNQLEKTVCFCYSRHAVE